MGRNNKNFVQQRNVLTANKSGSSKAPSQSSRPRIFLSKDENKTTLRSIGKELRKEADKALDPKTRKQKLLEKIERLGGPKAKKPYMNYKLLLEKKKWEKIKDDENRQQLKDVGMHDLLKKKRRKGFKKDPNNVGGSINQPGGKFKDGVLYLNKKTLAMVRQSDKQNK